MDLYGHTNPRQYDPTLILHAAEEKRSLGDLAGAQLLFESALLEWGDEAREKKRDVDQNLCDAITTLWLAYADFHRANKAWKSAMDTYEQAIQDPVAGKFGRVYLEYARFAEERDKLVTAQNVYIRALIGEDGQPSVTDEQDTTLLWNEFLEMMRKTTPTLNLTSLKAAVYKDHNQKRSQPELVSSINDMPEIKKSKYGEESSNTHVVTADDVESEYQSLLVLISQMPPEISAAWMARDGDAPPQAPEPPLFSPTRPKMSDPSGKDLIGSDMALQVTERLLCKSGTVMLETCRALWLMTALLEKEFTQTLDSLDKSMIKDFKAMEDNHHARLSVAGAASAAVRIMNDNERKNFEVSCSQRRQDVLGRYAWKFRELLCTQQSILTHLRVPSFEEPTVDARTIEFQSHVCTLLHTAFFLRKNLGEERHNKMLETQRERLLKDRDVTDVASPSGMSNSRAAAPSRNLSPMHGMPPTMYMASLPPPPPPPPLPIPAYGLPPPAGFGIPPQGYPTIPAVHPAPHYPMQQGGPYSVPPQPPYYHQ